MIKRFKLNNGIEVITKPMSGVRSVSIGFWVKTGSIHEQASVNGVSHFIEHMLFKGTHSNTARDIAMTMDGIGGELNAFTSKECTCFYAKVLDSHAKTAVDLISDMLLNSKFDPEEIKKEKTIILDEIYMYEDSAEDLVYDILAEVIFKDHSLGRPILGTEESLKELSDEQIVQFHKNVYTADNMIISVAGSVDVDELESMLNEAIGQRQFKKSLKEDGEKPVFHPGWIHRYKDIEQVHINLGFEGVPFEHDDAYALLILNNIIGGTTSSRLFQVIREDHGLSYSVYSHPSFYEEIGLLSIYASMHPDNVGQVAGLILEALRDLRNGKMGDDEIERSKEQLKGSYILGLEGTSNIMNMLGKSQLISGFVRSTDEVLACIENTTPSHVRKIANRVLDANQMALAIVGKNDETVASKIYQGFVEHMNQET